MGTVRCKPVHQPHGADDPGARRDRGAHKSRCPSWAADARLQRRLIDEALLDPAGAKDFLGRPKVIWNAVGGTVFIGLSTGETELAYNCFPNAPETRLHAELSRRANRTVDEYLAGKKTP